MSTSVRGFLYGALMLVVALTIVLGLASALQDRAEDVAADNATGPPQ
jgi:hypothetical protein